MSLDKALKNLKYDVRMIELNLKQGVITEAEYKQFMAQLNDSQQNSQALDIENQKAEDTQH
jgi:hypothetical protein